MVDALRYIGGLSHNTPTRSMLRHLEKGGLIEQATSVGTSEFNLTSEGEVLTNQAEAYFFARAIPMQRSGRMSVNPESKDSGRNGPVRL